MSLVWTSTHAGKTAKTFHCFQVVCQFLVECMIRQDDSVSWCLLTRRLAFLLRSSMQFAHSFVVQLPFMFKPFLSYFFNKSEKANLFPLFQHTINYKLLWWRFTKLVSAKEVVGRNYSFVNRHMNLIVCWKWKQIRYFFLLFFWTNVKYNTFMPSTNKITHRIIFKLLRFILKYERNVRCKWLFVT